MKASFFAIVVGGALGLLQVLTASAAGSPIYQGLKPGEPMADFVVDGPPRLCAS